MSFNLPKNWKRVKTCFVFLFILELSLGPFFPVFAQEATQSAQLAQTISIPPLPLPFQGQFPITQKFGEEVKDEALLARLVEKFGERAKIHNGLDFEIPEGSAVLAVDEGEITQAGEGDYGLTVVIKHSWGESLYGHLGSASVQAPQKVSKGQVIGLSGQTGITNGPHLHFGLKPNNPDLNNGLFGFIDPAPYLQVISEATNSATLTNQVLGEATPSASTSAMSSVPNGLTIPKMENIATDSAYLFNYKFNLINGNSAHFDSKYDPRPGFAIADKDYNYKLRFFLKEATPSASSGQAPSAQPKVEGNKIEFPVVIQGIPMTLRYTVTDNKVKEELIIDKPIPNNQLPNSNLVIPFEVQTVNLSHGKQDSQDVFTSSDGSMDSAGSPQVYWTVLAPKIEDSAGVAGTIEASMEESDSKQSFYKLVIDSQFLKTAAYPVIIDPTVVVTSWQEVTSQRTERSRTYQDTQNPNKYSWDGSLAPLHYESTLGSGAYNTSVDMTPVRVNNAQLDGWKVIQAGWQYALGQPGDKATDGWVGFGGRQGANWFKFRLARTGYLHWPTRAWQDVGGTPNYNRANLSNQTNNLTLGPNNDQIPVENVATWSNLWTTPGGGQLSVSWRANGERLKEEITLNQAGRNWIAANRPPTTPLSETYFGFVFQLDWFDIPKVVRAGIQQNLEGDFSDDSQNIELKDSLDRLLAFMPLDTVKVPNANPLLEETQPLRKRFWKDADGNYYLLVGIRTDTLNSMSAGDLVFDPTIDAQVGASSDDSYWTSDGGWNWSTEVQAGPISKGAWGYARWGYRFTGVTIPNGATITAAYLTFTTDIYAPYSGAVARGDLTAEKASSPATYSTKADFEARTLSTAVVAWDAVPAWNTADEEKNSPSIVSLINELMGSYSYAAGAPMAFQANGTRADSPVGRQGYSYNGSTTKAPKLHIEYTTNQNPNAPSSLGPTSLVDGSWTTDNTPTLTFTLSDPDASDTVKYQIQIDDTSDFSSAVVDYTSALAAQGATSFTVGQAAGSGSYTTGSAGQTLSDGSYYWRVKAIDNSAAASAYSTANAGAIAFKVDATAPSTPGTPSTTSPTTDTTPAWTWTASTDASSGLHSTTPYSVQWCTNSNFTGCSANTGTATTNSFTHSTALDDSTWYFRVKATDAVSNSSSYSSNGSVVIDTTAPSVSSVASTPTSSGATFTWTTNESSSSKVDYGPTNSYGSSTTESDTSPRVTSHSVSLTGLVSCATYHYRVRSKDSASNETIDSDNTFTTTGCLGSATVSSQTTSAITASAGGSVSLSGSNNTGVTLTIPASFTNSDANFQIKQLDYSPVITTAPPPSGYSIIGNYTYDLKALSDATTTVSSFDKQITIQITYTAAEIGGIEESTLKIYRWDGTTWQKLSGCTLDSASKTVTCTTTAFSIFALFGQPSSSTTTTLSTTLTPSCGDTAPGPKTPWLYGAIPQGQDTILLYFTHADGPVDKYVLEYGLTSGNYLWSAGDIGGRNTRTYLVQSLEPRTTYYFRVRAGNGCATGAWSNEISAKTGEQPLPYLTLEKLEGKPSLINPLTNRPFSFPKLAAKIPKLELPKIELSWISKAANLLSQAVGQATARLSNRMAEGVIRQLAEFTSEAHYRLTIALAILTGKGPNEISGVSVAPNSSTSVTIYWQTKHKSTSKVNYGFDTSYGLEKQDSRYANDHYITLENLEPSKTYYFEVMSQGIDYVYDAYYTFTTPNQSED